MRGQRLDGFVVVLDEPWTIESGLMTPTLISTALAPLPRDALAQLSVPPEPRVLHPGGLPQIRRRIGAEA